MHRSFIVRVNLADPAKMVLIECKFEIIYRCIVTPVGETSPFVHHLSLELVRPEVSYLKFGLIIRHVIDESSPLYGMDFEVWNKSTQVNVLFSFTSSQQLTCYCTAGALLQLQAFYLNCWSVGVICKALKARDASFTVTVSGTERSSMQPVFSENLYSVVDDDVIWDRQYEDQILTDKQTGKTIFLHIR